MAINDVNTPFSPQELKVAELLACGLSEKEIAEELCISPATVNNHTRHIREKNGLTKNTEIILLYIAYIKGKKFSLRDIKERSISIILIFINVCEYMTYQQ